MVRLCPKNPANPLQGAYTIPVPVSQIVFPGGDMSLIGNLEYRITIAGPVSFAPFMDVGIEPILRSSQLKISNAELDVLNSTGLWLPSPRCRSELHGGSKVTFSQYVTPLEQHQLGSTDVHRTRVPGLPAGD